MKKIIKKISAIITVVGMSLSISMGTSAYVCGDVNNDGSVSMSDSIALNKYLLGRIELVNYSAADVTGNYIINIIDADVLLAYLVNQVSSLPHCIPTE